MDGANTETEMGTAREEVNITYIVQRVSKSGFAPLAFLASVLNSNWARRVY